MSHRLSLAVAALIALAGAAGCASDEDAPIPQRSGRNAAAGVPPASNNSATVRGGLSTPTGL